MRSSTRPLSIVAILMLAGAGIWWKTKKPGHGSVLHPMTTDSSTMASPPGPPPQISPAESDGLEKAREDRNLQQTVQRNEWRKKLVGLINEAEQLSLTAESLALAQKPLTTEVRMTAVQKEVEGIAAGCPFQDIRGRAAHCVEAIKSRRAPKISEAAKTVRNMTAVAKSGG